MLLQMSMTNRLARLSCFLALTALVLMLTSPPEMTSSRPAVGSRRRTRHIGINPPTYSYHVRRMGLCTDDDAIFADCFFCGRLTNERRIYHACCHNTPRVRHYCRRLLS